MNFDYWMSLFFTLVLLAGLFMGLPLEITGISMLAAIIYLKSAEIKDILN